MTILENYWTIQEIAALFQGTAGRPKIHPSTVTAWIRSGVHGRRLPATLIGRSYLVHQRDLKKFLLACGLDPAEALS